MQKIYKALLEVQKSLDPVHKGRQGYGYKYADLPAVMEVCLEALNKGGVLVVQSPEITDRSAACVKTRLIHAESGEEVVGVIEVPYGEIAKMSLAQSYGSAMTYARRYSLVSMLGIVMEDDDGVAAGKPKKEVPKFTEEQKEAAAIASAQKIVRLKPEFPEHLPAFRDEQKDLIERCEKYQKAKEILEKEGIL